MLKKLLLIIIFAFLAFNPISHSAFAQSQQGTVQGVLDQGSDILWAVEDYAQELRDLNEQLPEDERLTEDQIVEIATQEIERLIASMQGSREDIRRSFDNLKTRVQKLPKNDPRRSSIEDIIGDVGSLKEGFQDIGEDIKDAFSKEDQDKTDVGAIDDFLSMDIYAHLSVLPSLGGSLPMAVPSQTFELAEEEAKELLSAANRVMIAPSKPASVPEGDLIEDFIPQLVRQLFRFAWVAAFVSFVVSGIMFIASFSNDDRQEKAKRILRYSVIGFIIVSLAFAIVKAITNIDFFRII